MAWLRLDDNFCHHPKFAGWTAAERWAFLELMSYCARYRTGGLVPTDLTLLPRSTTPRLLGRAEASGWLDRRPSGQLEIHDYTDYNPEANDERREKRRDAGRRGGQASGRSRRQKKLFEQSEANEATASPKHEAKNEANREAPWVEPRPVPIRSESKNDSERQRARDELWDALVKAIGSSPATKSERGRWNAALKQMREAGATAEDVRGRSVEYRKRWPDVSMTPTALAANWGSLAPKRVTSPPCPECGVGGGQHASDCPAVAPFSDADVQNVIGQIEAHREQTG